MILINLLAIDIGGSAIKHAIYNGKTLEEKGSVDTPLMRNEFLDILESIKESYDVTFDGCAISCPGDVDEDNGMVNGVSFTPFLHIVPILEEIETRLGLPVSMINDAQAAAVCEMEMGIGKGSTHPAFIIIGSGIGVSLVENGEVIQDTKDTPSRFKKMIVDMIRSYKGLSASPVQTARTVSLLKSATLDAYDGKEIYDLADEGDEVALKQIDKMTQSVAEILHGIDRSIQPEFFGLGGGITNNEAFVEGVRQKAKEVSQNKTLMVKFLELFQKETEDEVTLDIRVCEYKNDANLFGACLHFINTH